MDEHYKLAGATFTYFCDMLLDYPRHMPHAEHSIMMESGWERRSYAHVLLVASLGARALGRRARVMGGDMDLYSADARDLGIGW